MASSPTDQGLPWGWIELRLSSGLAIGRQIPRVSMLPERSQIFESGEQELARCAVVGGIRRRGLGLVHGQGGVDFGEP